jgi:hypothetical protein
MEEERGMMKEYTLIKFAAIIVICVLLDIALHVATSAYSTMPETPNYSALGELLGTEITATLWALIAFSSVAYVFHRFQNTIPGVDLTKGLRYGSAIALLWLFAMLEGVSLFGNPLINELIVGLSDVIPILVMSILLGVFVFKKGESTQPVLFTLKHKLLTICVFTTIFLVGRYVAYLTGIIQSGYQTSPFNTFLWTLLMGSCIGIVSILLGEATKTSSLARSAVRFGFWIFGVNWVVFLIFMPILFNGFFNDFIARITIDIVLVTIAYYMMLKNRKDHIQEAKG